MKGLLIKDLRLVFNRKQQLLILLALFAMIAFTADGSFIIGYAAGLTGIMGLSSLAFDEQDNGFPFLFSLIIITLLPDTGSSLQYYTSKNGQNSIKNRYHSSGTCLMFILTLAELLYGV